MCEAYCTNSTTSHGEIHKHKKTGISIGRKYILKIIILMLNVNLLLLNSYIIMIIFFTDTSLN